MIHATNEEAIEEAAKCPTEEATDQDQSKCTIITTKLTVANQPTKSGRDGSLVIRMTEELESHSREEVTEKTEETAEAEATEEVAEEAEETGEEDEAEEETTTDCPRTPRLLLTDSTKS